MRNLATSATVISQVEGVASLLGVRRRLEVVGGGWKVANYSSRSCVVVSVCEPIKLNQVTYWCLLHLSRRGSSATAAITPRRG